MKKWKPAQAKGKRTKLRKYKKGECSYRVPLCDLIPCVLCPKKK